MNLFYTIIIIGNFRKINRGGDKGVSALCIRGKQRL